MSSIIRLFIGTPVAIIVTVFLFLVMFAMIRQELVLR